MRRFAALLSFALLSGVLCFGKDIVIENDVMKLVLNENGWSESLICKADGREQLKKGCRLPLCNILQYRPYDNENFLMFPAKPMNFPSNRITRDGDTLRVEFRDTYDIAVISMNVRPQYISFTLERVDYRLEDFGVKRKTEIDEFALLQLPVLEKKHFGEWLNVSWDEKSAVCLLGVLPETRIDAFPMGRGCRRMYAGAESAVMLEGVGAVLAVSDGKEGMLDAIDSVEKDFGMPRGVESRRSEQYGFSYYECRELTPENVGRHIEYAKRGGFRQMVIYYTDFACTCGHYLFNDKYPGGIDDLKYVVSEMKKAGMTVGLHMHYCKVSTDDPYVCDGTPDPRFSAFRSFTLSSGLDSCSTTVYVGENPSGVRMEDGRRLIQIGSELISYESFSSVKPYCFKGCRRGVYNSAASDHSVYERFIQPDVDDWPRFIRIDQNSSIQDEIARNIANIYDSCGFEFLYFDGAEDVPNPYWYNVSRSQYKVWSSLSSPMLFAEGALKSHYGWHILSRGNAFDHFKEDKVHQAMEKYNLRAASRTFNDFTSVNFGWLYCDMSPETYEYICSEASKWNCPISYIAELDKMDKCKDIGKVLSTIKKYEDAK